MRSSIDARHGIPRYHAVAMSPAGAPRIRHAALLVAALAGAAAAVLPGGVLPAAAQDLLLGKVRRGAPLSISSAWQAEYDQYAPAAEDVAVLAAAPHGTRLDVYFGSWCSDSRAGVPHLLKILDAAGTSRIKLRLYGVDESKTEPARLLEGVGLERVPTIVLSVDHREIGRIVETPATTLEHDLALLVRKAAAALAP